MDRKALRCGRLQICDKVCALALLLDTGEDHFCARNVFLGVLQVLHQSILTPNDA